MRRPPLVSVIIPAYNAEAYLGAALASALKQTYPHLEVLVVNDGSTDGTAAVASAVADPRVRLLRQSNGGVAAARNLAIAHAGGTYVAPLDADDLWAPRKIEAQVRRMEAGGERMGLVYSWWVRVDEDGTARAPSHPWRMEGDLYGALFYSNFVGGASVPLFRRSALDRVGLYDPTLRARGGQGCEDWDLALRVARSYDVGLAPGYFCGYRHSPESMSRNTASMARSYDLMTEAALQHHPAIPRAVRRWSRAQFRLYLASVSRDDHRSALRWMWEAFRADPLSLAAPPHTRLLARSLLTLTAGRSATERVSARFGRPRPYGGPLDEHPEFRAPPAPAPYYEATTDGSDLPWDPRWRSGRRRINQWHRAAVLRTTEGSSDAPSLSGVYPEIERA